MTLEEMAIIANICATADNGCSTCASDLLDRLEKQWPEYSFEFTQEEIMEDFDWYNQTQHGSIEDFRKEYGQLHKGYKVEVTLK